MAKMEEIIKSKNFKIIALVMGIIIIALVSFDIGMKVGFHKAKFSYTWGENYERNFMPPGLPPGPMGFFPGFDEGRGYRNGHGLAGTIISIAENSLIIKDRDNKENTVAVTDKTIIQRRHENLQLTDLKANDQVTILGSPDDNGVVNASFIRVFNNNEKN